MLLVIAQMEQPQLMQVVVLEVLPINGIMDNLVQTSLDLLQEIIR